MIRLHLQDSKSYAERIKESQKAVGEKDALIVMQGSIKTVPIVVAVFEFKFMGGSMGSVVGERFARGVQTAIENKAAFVCINCQRRGAYARRPAITHANGKNQCGAYTVKPSRVALYFSAD